MFKNKLIQGLGNQFNLKETKSLLVGFAILLFAFVGIDQSATQAQDDYVEMGVFHNPVLVKDNMPVVDSVALETFLPIVHRVLPPEITKDYTIWAHASEPSKHEVALFRRKINLDEMLKNVELHIFADTRYEVWFDNQWIGRGPARFSLTTREFDVYQLGELDQGEHLIAVLVQWAPNYRRSESTTPYLQAHIQGKGANFTRMEGRTGTQWKAYLTDAWKNNSTQVHSWGLIGPTELMDFGKIPSNWMKKGFNDSDWPAAVIKETIIQVDQLGIHPQDSSLDPVKSNSPVVNSTQVDLDLSQGIYRPRSIQILDNVPIPIKVLDRGLLSPGRLIGEITPGSSHVIKFEATKQTSFSVEILSDIYPVGIALLDGAELSWTAAGSQRPDVYIGTTNLSSGNHQLTFNSVSDTGTTFSMTANNIKAKEFPFAQGVHAGRRLLLAEPVTDGGSTSVSSNGNVAIVFNSVPSYAVLDLGRTVYGRLSSTISGPQGAIVDIGWDERLLGGTLRPLPYPGSLHPQWNQTDSWVLDGTTRNLTTIDARGGRYILIAAWGNGPIELSGIKVHEERYPLTQIGEFQSSDSSLDQIWQLGVNTLYSNMSDAYSDPWRERGQWWGDAYVIDQVNQIVFGETDLLRRGISFMSEAFDGGRPKAMAPNGYGVHMLDYGMLWVHSLREYLQLTGDTEILRETYQTMSSFLNFLQEYKNSSTGLLDIPAGGWSQTTYIDSIGWDSRHGQSTAVNAMYYSTLLNAASIADITGDFSSADNWRDRAEAVKQAINANLYLENEHQYLSSIFDGENVEPTAHAQAFALTYEIVPENDILMVANSLLNLISMDPENPDVEVYGTYWVLKALGKAGLINEALNIIKTYFGHWLDYGSSSTWEIFNADQNYSQSLSHGWGASPTWFLSTYLLGAEQVGPDAWSLTPSFSELGYLSGTIPLSEGNLHILYDQVSCGEIKLSIKSPEKSMGTIWLNDTGRDYVISMNGTSIWDGNTSLVEWLTVEPNAIQVQVGGGYQNLIFHRECH